MTADVKFWATDAAIRAVKTFSQSLVALFGANAFDVLHVDWKVDLSVALGAAVVSVLQNVQSIPLPKHAAAAEAPTVEVPPVVTPPTV